MNRQLSLVHGALDLPAFLPDATLGVVRAVDSTDVAACGIQGVVMNTFHLMQHPGTSTVQALGGLHAMAGWSGPIVTDSGGFQAYSLIRENPKYGTLTDDGIVVRPDGSDRKYQLTPEKCVQLQVSYGADVVMCLDDCTHVDDPWAVQEQSVQRTIAWAARCRKAFDQLMDQKRLPAEKRPKLFAVVQGGGSPELRRRCAEPLLAMGFDGYGYGGWPLDADGRLVDEMLAYARELIPAEFPMHALGIGHPVNVATCYELGYDIFDCALPTRDARRGRLYVRTGEPEPQRSDWFRFLYITDDKYIKARLPVDETCDCLCCTRYTRGYMHHLHHANEAVFQRLATIHNLRFMARLVEKLRVVINRSMPD
ncbi:MAG: tRNA guanosine(34) transglycosylase Tgt [Anaerolineales bacterium]|nr:tRNA guanosine(34) transglycosylase Tgt [Anaerolineales bacterium]